MPLFSLVVIALAIILFVVIALAIIQIVPILPVAI